MQEEASHLFRHLLQFINEREFQTLVSEIFKGMGYEVHQEYNAGEYRFDLRVVRDDQPLFIELTLAKIINESLLKRMEELAKLVERPVLLIVGQVLPLSRKRGLFGSQDIKVWDASDLYAAAPESVIRQFLVKHSLLPTEEPQQEVDGFALYSQLHTISPGRKDALKFQEWVKDILSYLFVPPLAPAFYEKRDEGGFNRRDIIFPNRSYDGFWRALSIDYKAPFITVDAKNHTDPIGKPEVLGLSHYLKPYGLGLFGMLISREGLSLAGKHAVREHWIGQSKMIVSVTTTDLHDMVEVKMQGGSPENTIDNLVTAFRLSL